MRRYILYFAAAFLTFAFGSCVVFNLYRAESDKREFTFEQTKPVNNIEIKLPAPKKSFTCQDEAAKTVWEQLKKEKDFIEWADYIVETSETTDCRQLFEIKRVDLNADRFDEVILRGSDRLCGTGADCRTWILSKTNNKYRVILDLYASEFEDPQILRAKTNKFHNLKITKNNHRGANTYGFFEFDGKKYRVAKCLEDVNSDESENPDYEADMIAGLMKLIPTNSSRCQ